MGRVIGNLPQTVGGTWWMWWMGRHAALTKESSALGPMSTERSAKVDRERDDTVRRPLDGHVDEVAGGDGEQLGDGAAGEKRKAAGVVGEEPVRP